MINQYSQQQKQNSMIRYLKIHIITIKDNSPYSGYYHNNEHLIIELLQYKYESLVNMISLNLQRNYFQNHHLQHIFKFYDNLEKVSLAYNKLTSNGLKYFMKENKFHKLTFLNLAYNKIGNEGIKILIKIELPEIRRIFLANCQINDEGMKNLIKGNWKNINQVVLRDNNIRYYGFLYLYYCSWSSMKTFSITDFPNKTCQYIPTIFHIILSNIPAFESHYIRQHMHNNQKMKNGKIKKILKSYFNVQN